jgi:hypothetical protein
MAGGIGGDVLEESVEVGAGEEAAGEDDGGDFLGVGDVFEGIGVEEDEVGDFAGGDGKGDFKFEMKLERRRERIRRRDRGSARGDRGAANTAGRMVAQFG